MEPRQQWFNKWIKHETALKVSFHVRISLKDVFEYADHPENGTYSLGYKLTIYKISADNVLRYTNRCSVAAWDTKAVIAAVNGALEGRINTNSFSWHVTNCSPIMPQDAILSKHNAPRAKTELTYTKRPVLTKCVTAEKNWTVELGLGSGIIPVFVRVGFQEKNCLGHQHM